MTDTTAHQPDPINGANAAPNSIESASAGPSAIRKGLLQAQQLKKTYKSRTVVHDVSFDVGAGEIVGLLGPNGAGKTTSFYMVVGLVAADAGQILLDGADLAHMPIHRRARLGLSYLPQEASIFRKLNVEENVRAILELRLNSKADIDRQLEIGRAHV